MKDLNEELLLAKDGVRAAKARENSLREELETLSKDLQRSQKSHNKLQNEKETLEDQLDELKKKVQRLSSGLQVRLHAFFTPIHFYHEWLRSRYLSRCSWAILTTVTVLDSESVALFFSEKEELLLSVWFNRAFLWQQWIRLDTIVQILTLIRVCSPWKEKNICTVCVIIVLSAFLNYNV